MEVYYGHAVVTGIPFPGPISDPDMTQYYSFIRIDSGDIAVHYMTVLTRSGGADQAFGYLVRSVMEAIF